MPPESLRKRLIRLTGHEEVLADIDLGQCPKCHEKIDLDSFTTDFGKAEYEICGYCEKCTENAFAHVRESLDKGICSRCGEEVIPSAFTQSIQIQMYYKFGVCASCQRELVKKMNL